MISVVYSLVNDIQTFSSNAISWIKAHGKLIAAISAIAVGILSVIAGISIRRFNPGLSFIFFVTSFCSLVFVLKILGFNKSNQTLNDDPLYYDSLAYSPDFSDSHYSSDNDDWVDFGD